MNKFIAIMLALGGGVLVLIGVWALSLGYLPEVGQALHMGRAKDLGVTYSDVDYVNAKLKFEEASSAQAVKQVFSGEELTALINTCSDKACIVNSAQIKTHADGVVEVSGVVDKSKVIALLNDAIENADGATDIGSIAKYLPPQPSFYLKAGITGQDDVIVLDLQKAKVAGFELSGSDLGSIEKELESAIVDYLASLSGTQIFDFTIDEEGIYVDADFREFVADGHGG